MGYVWHPFEKWLCLAPVREMGARVMIYRQPAKYRAWWESLKCQQYGCGGSAAMLLASHLTPLPHFIPDNDRDHIRW